MKRRQFLSLAGTAAIGTTALTSLTPDFDPVPESEMWAMAPQGVSIHTSRVAWNRDDPRAFAEPPQVDNAVEQLAALKPRAIVYAFSSSSYALGAEADDAVRARLEKRAGGIRVVLTCLAATEAFRFLGAHRVAVIHPPWFSEEVNAKGMDYFRTQGFAVVLCARMTPARAFTEVPPAEVYEWVSTNVPKQAETVFIAGNGLRAVGAIHALEKKLRRPVLTANQVALWKALRVSGTTSKVTRYGSLFTYSGPTR